MPNHTWSDFFFKGNEISCDANETGTKSMQGTSARIHEGRRRLTLYRRRIRDLVARGKFE